MLLSLIMAALILIYLILGFPIIYRYCQGLQPIERLKRGFQFLLGLLMYITFGAFLAKTTGRGVFILDIYILIPVLLQCFALRRQHFFALTDILTIMAIWFPLEFGLLPNILIMGVPFQMVTALLVLLLVYIFFYPARQKDWDLGFVFTYTVSEVLLAVKILILLLLVTIPLGLGIKFLAYNPGLPAHGIFALILLQYFFIAIPEELLFRGVIQHSFEKYMTPLYSLVSSSVIFALAHVNNVSIHHTVPNWSYVLMALFAGLAYGYVWQRTRKVTVSALVHASLNVIWIILFRG